MICSPAALARPRMLAAGVVAMSFVSTAGAGDAVIPADVDSFSAADQSVAPRVSAMPYVEDFDSLDIGGLNGQGNWYGQAGAKVVDQGIERQSVVHRTQTTIGGTYLAMSSPSFDAGYSRLDVDVLIGSDNSTYFLETVSEPSFLVNTRLRFGLDGTIDALQSNDGEPVFADTLGSWSSGSLMRIGIEVGPDGALSVYQNGEQIFSGFDVAFTHGEETGISRFSVVGAYEDTDDFVMIDNLTVPSPGGVILAMLSGVLMVAPRRRAA